MRDLILIFVGGGLGSIVRYGLGRSVGLFYETTFPIGTLAVNFVACFALGAVIGVAESKHMLSPQTRLFWTVGFCGGFSTFSTFSFETLTLLQQGLTSTAMLYVASSVIICIASTWLGIWIAAHA